MVKIAFVIDDLGLGGAQRQLLELVKRLDRRRFQPVLYALSEKKIALKDAFEKAGLSVILFDQRGKISFPVLFKLWKALRQFSPTIVHTYLFTADFYGRLAARMAGVPMLISSVRSTEPDKKQRYILVDRYLGRWCDAVIGNASCIGEILAAREKIKISKIYTIHNGVDLGRFPYPMQNGHLRKSLEIPEDAFVLGTVGRLGPEKDHRTLLQAASQLFKKNVKPYLLLIGDGPLYTSLVRLGEELGIATHLRWLGARSDIPELLAGIDLFILPSRYEGCPNVVLEAMAAGKCVVATRVGGTPEVVQDGETGILVRHGQTDELVEALSSLLQDPRRVAEIGQKARESITKAFTVERMVEKTEALYERLLQAKGISS
ncbi:MAG: glycosyltransferase [Candidatus Omnitrophica bacterium]|nr:glycosyltransferase [Candidatus Omnitrophota bacterium]